MHVHSNKHSYQHSRSGRLWLSILLNVIITIGQIIGSLISGSLSLLSDALHNFSDVISLIISYIASILSNKQQTVSKTFGFKRAEIIAAFINASTLIVVAIYLGIEAVKRFYEPLIITSDWVIGMAGMSIIINGISVLLLQRDVHDNMNIKSAYLHLFSDMLTSVAVLAGGIIIFYLKIYWIDGLLTLIISIYLIYMSWDILKKSLKVLMLFTPSSIFLEEIDDKIKEFENISNIHHVHVWQLNDKQIHFEAHVDFTKDLSLSKVNDSLNQIKEYLRDNYNIEHVTFQPEFDNCHDKALVNQGH